MKKLFLLFVLLSITATSMCQLKVESDSTFKLGSSGAPHFQVKPNGNVVFGAQYPLTIKTNGIPSIKSDVGSIWFGGPAPIGGGAPADWLEVWAQSFVATSDSRLKEDIVPIGKSIPILKQINTYSYFFKADTRETRQREYGVMAQEVEALLPDLVRTVDDIKGVNYGGFIPFLIEAAKEQQNEIEMLQKIIAAQELDLIELKALRSEFTALQEMVSKCCNEQGALKNEELQPVQERAELYQNTPNPFTANTEIVCNLPNTAKQAALYIYNLQGIELKAYPLTQTGLTTITVNGSELPAGMYLYTLVVNNEIVDTKRMILTK